MLVDQELKSEDGVQKVRLLFDNVQNLKKVRGWIEFSRGAQPVGGRLPYILPHVPRYIYHLRYDSGSCIMEAEKPHRVLSAGRRPREVTGVV